MSCCVDQCTLIVLAMDLDQSTANLFEYLHADRLIVDKSPCATIGELHTAQDEFVLHGNIIGRQQRAGGVIACDVEHSRHLALFHAMPDQRLVAASAQSQRESVEQDRLAGTCLAREHCEPFDEINVEPVDQDDIANRKSGEHGFCRVLAFVTPGPVPGVHALQIRHH